MATAGEIALMDREKKYKSESPKWLKPEDSNLLTQATIDLAAIQIENIAYLAAKHDDSIIKWADLLDVEQAEIDWLVYPLIERGKSIALVSEAKAGKSLLALEIASGLSAGRSVLGNPERKIKVLYVDMENAQSDLRERLQAFNYKSADLEGLIYLSFPSLPVLDTKTGGEHLLALAKTHGVELVVIDTLSRVVEGDENDAATYNNLYRHALVKLKELNIAIMRLDHLGKDATKGARGSSAKMSDVDAIWGLKANAEIVTLTRTHSRSNHGVSAITLERTEDPLRHEVVTDGATRKLEEFSLRLDAAGIPRNSGRPTVSAALKGMGIKVSSSLQEDLVRFRKSLAVSFVTLRKDFTADEILLAVATHAQGTAPDFGGSEDFEEQNND